MAKIDALPSLEIINTLKGTLDFYYWKGIPCVRKWPHIPHSSRTQPSLDSAHLFGLIVQGWALVGGAAKTLYWASAADQPRTGRDLYVSGVLGGQHEASMSDFLDLLIECKDYLADLQALLGPLGSVDTDDLQVDIKSALATLPVKGQDQLFSIDQTVLDNGSAVISGAGGYFVSGAVPANHYWVITTIAAWDVTTPCTKVTFLVRLNGNHYHFHQKLAAIAADQMIPWSGSLLMPPTSVVRAGFVGSQAGDAGGIQMTGFQMTQET